MKVFNMCYLFAYDTYIHTVKYASEISFRNKILPVKSPRILTFHQFSPIAQLCLTHGDPVDCSTPGFSVITNFRSLLRLTSIESVMPWDGWMASSLIISAILEVITSDKHNSFKYD